MEGPGSSALKAHIRTPVIQVGPACLPGSYQSAQRGPCFSGEQVWPLRCWQSLPACNAGGPGAREAGRHLGCPWNCAAAAAAALEAMRFADSSSFFAGWCWRGLFTCSALSFGSLKGAPLLSRECVCLLGQQIAGEPSLCMAALKPGPVRASSPMLQSFSSFCGT